MQLAVNPVDKRLGMFFDGRMRITKATPRPHRLLFITEAIEGMRLNEAFTIHDAANGSVKSIASRLRRKYKKKRRWVTEKDRTGTWICRIL